MSTCSFPGGGQAKNVFWSVAGGAGAEIGTDSQFEGVLLTQTAINVLTGASFTGKLLAQTDVNLQMALIQDLQPIQYTLTYTAGPGGSIDGDTPQLVMEGEDGTPVTAEANTGFEFVQWSDESTINPRSDLNVMEDITVEAQFEELGVAGGVIPVPTLDLLGRLLLVLMLTLAGGWFIRKQSMIGHSNS